jgi:uncharacterized membrane protein
MVDNVSAVVAILLLTLVTIMTRVSGVWIMSHVRITPRIEAFLKYMAASVLISIVVSATLAATPRIWLAVGVAVVVMVVTRSALAAMLIGTVLAAGVRTFAL